MSEKTPHAPIRVLLVDDHTVLRDGMRLILDQEEDMLVVGEAGSGEEALVKVEALQPDIVVMDIGLPGMNGIETTRRLKGAYPHTGVVVLTNYDDDEYLFTMLKAGATGYLLKNAAGNELVAAIRAVYRGESSLQPAVTKKLLEEYTRSGTRTERPAESRQAARMTRDDLTEREIDVLKLVAQGSNNRAIADKLSLSVRTVENHLVSIYSKLGLTERTELVLYAMRKGLVAIPKEEW